LNKCLEDDCQRTIPIDDLLQRFGDRKFLTSLDLSQGFLQVKMSPEARKYLAFIFEGQNYQFTRLPFGTKQSTSIFTKAVREVLGHEFDDFVSCYVDDVLIASRTLEEHLQHIERVLRRFREKGVTVKLKKSEFIRDEVKFLGYVLGTGGIRVDEERIERIKEFKEPRNKKELLSFLGLCNYYRKFRDKYSELTAKFGDILSGKKEWRWNEEHKKTFEKIKEEFLKVIVLKHPDFSKEFYINTDASNLSVSAVLAQLDEEGEERVICFASRVLTKVEKAYSITEKELLAVVFACKKFRSYLIGHPKIIIRTDHKALSFLGTCKLTHGRMLRWSLLLQEFNLEIRYIPGKQNVPADVLSRTAGEEEQVSKNEHLIKVLRTRKDMRREADDLEKLMPKWRKALQEDGKWKAIMKILKKEDPDRGNIGKLFMEQDGFLFKRKDKEDEYWRLCVPEGIIDELVGCYHVKYGHIGGQRVYDILKDYCIFKGMQKRVKTLLKKCDLCQKAKHDTKKAVGELHPIIPKAPKEIVAVDLIGELPTGKRGMKYLFVVVDTFTKYVKLYPVKRANAKVLSDKITQQYIPLVGDIKSILSDRGTQFTSKLWQNEMKKRGIMPIHSSVYHPQSNPTERTNKEIGKICRMMCHEKHTRWTDIVQLVEDCLNLSKHGTTEEIPFEMMFGERVKDMLERVVTFPMTRSFDHKKKLELVAERLKSKAEKRKNKHDRGHRFVKYQVGDLVLVRTHHLSDLLGKKIKKFFLLYEGPYRVKEIKMENAYVLVDETNNEKGTYNTTQLKKYHS